MYLQFEHGEEIRSITFEGRVRLRVDFNPIGPVVAVEPVDGAVVIEAESKGLPEAISRGDGRPGPRPAAVGDSAPPDAGVQPPSFADARRRAAMRARKRAAAPAVRRPPDRAP